MSGKRKDRGDGPRIISIGTRPPAPAAAEPVAPPRKATPEELSAQLVAQLTSLAACEDGAAPAAAKVASLAAMASGTKTKTAFSLKRETPDAAAPVERLKPRQP